MLTHCSDAVAYGLLLLSSFQAASADAPLQVQTSSGSLTGFINCTAPSVRQFLGVPFALPPTGKLRFEPPVKVTDNGPLQVKAFKPSCMQSVSGPVNTSDPNTDVYAIMPQFGINGGISEDCLYLNVYAPLNPTTPSLPVIVWIYGGGFTNGGANVLYQIPDKWVQRTQGHVVVTMNYRLGVFGYPSAPGQMKNVGLMDQRMVVEWVRDNIAAFGGDPARISLMGQSAGSASVNFYAYSYVDDPIVAGFIGHSGAASILTSTDASGSNFNTLADSVGCGKLSAAAELQCMQNVDAAKLQAAAESNRSRSFFPYADNITAPANPADRLAKGLVAKKPFLMGNTDNEGGGLSTIGGMTPEARRFGLSGLACPVIDEANQRFQHGYVTYRYLYAGNFSNISPLPWIGACHSCDLPLAFGTHYEYDNTHTGLKSTDLEWGTSFAMEGLWLSFASNPNESPRYKDYTWPQYNPNTTSIALIGFNTPIQPISTGWFDGNCTGL